MFWDAKVEFSLQFDFEAGFCAFRLQPPCGFPSPTGVAYDPTIFHPGAWEEFASDVENVPSNVQMINYEQNY